MGDGLQKLNESAIAPFDLETFAQRFGCGFNRKGRYQHALCHILKLFLSRHLSISASPAPFLFAIGGIVSCCVLLN
jgi:hypothetical protein